MKLQLVTVAMLAGLLASCEPAQPPSGTRSLSQQTPASSPKRQLHSVTCRPSFYTQLVPKEPVPGGRITEFAGVQQCIVLDDGKTSFDVMWAHTVLGLRPPLALDTNATYTFSIATWKPSEDTICHEVVEIAQDGQILWRDNMKEQPSNPRDAADFSG
jgi:hypothetical protein